MKKEYWTLEKIRVGLETFYKEHSRYPTSVEIDTFAHLPSSRQIQRRFGGLVSLRQALKLNGPTDFTKGTYSSARARTINKRAHSLEKNVYRYLTEQFGDVCVHREYFFSDDKRTRTDFFVYSKEGNFSIDVFYPKDRHNLIGCLNSKMRGYKGAAHIEYPVIFLMMNESISEGEVIEIIRNKKNKLRPLQQVMTFNQLKDFCAERHPPRLKT